MIETKTVPQRPKIQQQRKKKEKTAAKSNPKQPSQTPTSITEQPEVSKGEKFNTEIESKVQDFKSAHESLQEKAGEPKTSPTKTIVTKEAQPSQVIAHENFALIQPFIPRRLNLRDVRFHVQHGNSTNYSFNGKTYQFPFQAQYPECFKTDFLEKIKKMIHLSPKTNKLPNLAQGAIIFHYQMKNEDLTKTIKLEELFLSGGKFFGKNDLAFKAEHRIVNAMQDMLTREEREYIHNLPHGKKSIPLGIAMEKHLRRNVIEGPWKNNCVDSEAIFILKLLQKLPSILRYQLFNGSEHSITLKWAVLAISSYRDGCSNCEKLIQGFQWRLRDLILGFHIPGLTVDENFGTLAIVKGHIRGLYPQAEREFIKGNAILQADQHTLISAHS